MTSIILLLISTLTMLLPTIVLLPLLPCAVELRELLVVSVTGGHQLVVPALLQTLILLPYLKVFSSIVIMAFIHVLLQTALEIQEITVHV